MNAFAPTMGKGTALLLASRSPRRVALMRQFDLDFDVIVPNVEELTPATHSWLSPRELALTNAQLKAHAARRQKREGWILAADTVVALEGEIFGKPRDQAQAAKFLQRLSGRTHYVVTGVALLSPDNRLWGSAEITDVRFHELTPEKISRYIAQVDVLDKAGAYSYEQGRTVIAAIRGSPSNVIGLPLERLHELLCRTGVLQDCMGA